MGLANKLLLDIEIPIANKQGVIYSHFIPSLQYLAPIKDYIRFLINFNGDTTTKDIVKVRAALRHHGFHFLSTVKKYNFEKGKADNLIIRRDTHAIAKEHAPYFLFIDDDVKITNIDYCKDIMASLLVLSKDKQIGAVSMANRLTNKPQAKSKICYMDLANSTIYTGGGIIFKNIEEWNDIIPLELTYLFGCNVDNLLGFVRLQNNYYLYLCETDNYEHFEHHVERGGQIISGVDYYNWRETIYKDNSVSKYLMQFKQDPDDYTSGLFKKELFKEPKNQVFLNYKNYTLEQLISEVTS